MSDINWNQEFRKIEREYDGLPPLHTRTQIRMQRIQEVISKAKFEERLSIFGIWTRLILVGALGTALFWWPYGNACGFPLATFLASYVMVIVGGLALAARTWRDRLIWPFLGSALFVVAAWTVVASIPCRAWAIRPWPMLAPRGSVRTTSLETIHAQCVCAERLFRELGPINHTGDAHRRVVTSRLCRVVRSDEPGR